MPWVPWTRPNSGGRMPAAETPVRDTECRMASSRRKKNDPPRKRARDEGRVKPLGVEVDADLFEKAEQYRFEKKWSKRVLVEEALRKLLGPEGSSPPQSK